MADKSLNEIRGTFLKYFEKNDHKIVESSNLLPDYKKITPFLKKYVEAMGWDDLNWLEDVHMGYEEERKNGMSIKLSLVTM